MSIAATNPPPSLLPNFRTRAFEEPSDRAAPLNDQQLLSRLQEVQSCWNRHDREARRKMGCQQREFLLSLTNAKSN